MPKMPRWWWIAPVLVLVAYVLLQTQTTGSELRYDELLTKVRAGEVESVILDGELVRGELKQAPDGRRAPTFTAARPDDPRLVPLLEEHGVQIRAVPERNASWLSWVWMILPLLLLLALFSRMASGGGAGPGGALAFGKAKGKIFTERDVNVTFDDVAGVDEAKQELREVLDFLGSPDKYRALGARIPKGILLVGPPGTGKTLLARAVAGEAKVPFISISGSEFVEMFVGVGAARVRDLFEQAAKAAPAIVFIDELDALGRSRGPSVMGNNEEREQTLNQLLVELDGFEPLGEGRGAVVILAATNRPEVLDPALLRAGRFDRQVVVDRPDRAGRKKILEVHARKVPLEDVDLDAIAARTPGFAGADLANLVNEAALRAAREGREVVTMADFSSAQDRVLAGLEQRSRLVDPEERRRVAFHECGHAIAARLGGSDAKVHKVSIVPRSIGALGFTMQMPERERRLFTATQLRAQLVGLVGGRAAEEIVFGEASTGAADDLRKATDLARAMVLEHGLSEAIGPVSIERRNTYLGGVANDVDVGQTTANAADAEVRRLVEHALAEAKALLTKERARLDAMAEALLEAEVLEGDVLDRHLSV